MEEPLNIAGLDLLAASRSRSRSRSFEHLDALTLKNIAQHTISTETTEVTANTLSNDNLSSARTTPVLDLPSDKETIVEAPAVDVSELSPTFLENDDDEEEVIAAVPKRKRTSIKYDPDDLSYNAAFHGNSIGEPHPKRSRGSQKIRGIIIGVWRDSDQPADEEKHVIYGFIDIHDRLRTRIYGMNRRGEELIGNAPTGAGGCWVTFPRIIFEPHLRDQTQAVIKEYVRIRTSIKQFEADPEDRRKAELKALADATAIAANMDTSSPSGKAFGHRSSLGRHQNGPRRSLPHQPLHKAPSFQAVNAMPSNASPAPDTKPHGVLLGYWSDSSEHRPEDKHAVYGVIGGSDCFRVKVQRLTRDGRYVDGNFPVGAGALWIHYDKVVFEPHLANLSRPEVKEYTRIRQRQLDNGESDRDRPSNELAALHEAQAIVANEGLNNSVIPQQRPSPEIEVRHSARSEQRLAARQQAEAQAEAAATAERLRQEKAEARERQHEKSRKEVAAAEAVIQESAQLELQKNIKKLNKVWVAQQAATLPQSGPASASASAPDSEEVKYYHGIKYERKQNGPFQGKFVGGAQIISIDGEDYVEYRVLTKPQ